MLESVESGNGSVGGEGAGQTPEAVRASSPQEAADEWSVKQEKAMAALAAGKSITRAAHEAGVTRRTIQLWQKQNPEFRAAVQRWKRETRRAARAVLFEGVESAAAVVVEASDGGDAYAALQLLRATGVIPPAGAKPAKVAKPAAPGEAGKT
jgi:hypothetical protein